MLMICDVDNPKEDPQARGDPFRTLFVARLSYDTKESDLEREFGRFGPIERVRCVILLSMFIILTSCRQQIRIVTNTHEEGKNPKKKHRGYAFIVYERERDMKGIKPAFFTCLMRIKYILLAMDMQSGVRCCFTWIQWLTCLTFSTTSCLQRNRWHSNQRQTCPG